MKLALTALMAVIIANLSLAGFFLLDKRPVQNSISRKIVEYPKTATPGAPFVLEHKTTRLRDVPTISVQHFLVAENDRGLWVLVTHRGLQRPVGDSVYTTISEWPTTAGPGRYIWRIVVAYQCNALKVCVESYESEPFEVK